MRRPCSLSPPLSANQNLQRERRISQNQQKTTNTQPPTVRRGAGRETARRLLPSRWNPAASARSRRSEEDGAIRQNRDTPMRCRNRTSCFKGCKNPTCPIDQLIGADLWWWISNDQKHQTVFFTPKQTLLACARSTDIQHEGEGSDSPWLFTVAC